MIAAKLLIRCRYLSENSLLAGFFNRKGPIRIVLGGLVGPMMPALKNDAFGKGRLGATVVYQSLPGWCGRLRRDRSMRILKKHGDNLTIKYSTMRSMILPSFEIFSFQKPNSLSVKAIKCRAVAKSMHQLRPRKCTTQANRMAPLFGRGCGTFCNNISRFQSGRERQHVSPAAVRFYLKPKALFQLHQ